MPDGRHSDVRMDMDELDGYEQAVRDAQTAFPEITVLLALECEDFPENRAFYREEILGRREFDYLVGAAHYTPFEGAWHNSYSGSSHDGSATGNQCRRLSQIPTSDTARVAPAIPVVCFLGTGQRLSRNGSV